MKSMPVDFDHGPAETVEEFLNNCAKWHKTCHLKFATSKLERSKERCKNKRKDEDNCESGERRSKRRALSAESRGTVWSLQCIFCMDSQETLHNCSTLTHDN